MAEVPNTSGDTRLRWSIAAMNDACERLAKGPGTDLPGALALVSEAVWWVTLVEATIIRYGQAAWDQALAELAPADRRATEGTFTGLRFVRAWMGYHADMADFIEPQPGPGDDAASFSAWAWALLPTPELGVRSPRDHNADAVRYRHYCAQLAHKPVNQTIARAAAFINGITLICS